MLIIEIDEILVDYVFGKARCPVNAVEKCSYVRQILGIECTFIFSRAFVIVIFIELRCRIYRFDTIFSVDTYQIDSSPVNRIIFISPNAFNLFGLNLGDW